MSDHSRRSEVIEYKQMLEPIQGQISELESDLLAAHGSEQEFQDQLDGLLNRAESLAKLADLPEAIPPKADDFLLLDKQVDLCLLATATTVSSASAPKAFPPLSVGEYTFSALAGALAAAIDLIFVGTPEIVKIYRGGENFDGSILTAAIRKFGTDSVGTLSPILQWFSEKCKVPYDLSCVSGVLTPNNHRLRSLSHDPFLGLFFAVADIILGTTTCIDNDGKLTVLIGKRQSSPAEKLLSVLIYAGHILSDLCTARGIPIPGFFLTQFFADGESNHSLAEIAERMYQDGYDTRHLASMSVPVAVKELLIHCYFSITPENVPAYLPIAEKEQRELGRRLKREKMNYVASSVCIAGNAAKFFLPPNFGNPCALNIPEWYDWILSSLRIVKAAGRELSVEQVMQNRKSINDAWSSLKQI